MDRQLREWASEQRLESAPVRVELVLRRELRARRWRRRLAWAAPLAAAAALAVFFWPRPAAAPVVATVETPQPFVPVGAWQAVEPIERARIVRTEVPRATLVSFGMPVTPGRLTEPAPVELLLGEDGTVRGIRLVSSIQ